MKTNENWTLDDIIKSSSEQEADFPTITYISDIDQLMFHAKWVDHKTQQNYLGLGFQDTLSLVDEAFDDVKHFFQQYQILIQKEYNTVTLEKNKDRLIRLIEFMEISFKQSQGFLMHHLRHSKGNDLASAVFLMSSMEPDDSSLNLLETVIGVLSSADNFSRSKFVIGLSYGLNTQINNQLNHLTKTTNFRLLSDYLKILANREKFDRKEL